MKAFPTAEGFGAQAVGGRGGIVMQVTTLADSGPGSLRACVAANVPRTCVFRVGGSITVQSQMSLGGGYLTIAGQTAPGGGILLRAASNMAPGALLRINRNDVILRYMRFRRGASGAADADANDSLQLLNATNVMLDHVSVSWGVDEDLGLGNSSNVTVQWSIISEGLYHSNHPKGPHSMGVLLYEDQNVSVHHNIFAHNQERNPRVKVVGIADIVNNLIYNSGTEPVIIGDDFGHAQINFVGNTYRKGMNSPSSNYTVRAVPVAGGGGIEVFATGNDVPGGVGPVRETQYVVGARFAAPQVATQAAATAYASVTAQAGALPHDAVDLRILDEIAKGKGRIIDSPADVGGWPVVASGSPYPDNDQDGMSDSWELAHGLNPASAADRNDDRDGDGYTNLEEFLNSLPAQGGSSVLPGRTSPALPPGPSRAAGAGRLI